MSDKKSALLLVVLESTAVQCLASFAMLAVPAIAPDISRSSGIPASLVGVQISLAYGGAMMTSLLAGLFVRRLGAVRTSQWALLLCVAACAGLAWGWLPAMVLATLLLGFGYGMINPAASHLLIKATHDGNRNLVFSIKQTGVPLGGMLAGAILPLIAVSYGWQWSLILVALIAVILTLVLQSARPIWDRDRDPSARLDMNPLIGLVEIWRNPTLRTLSITGFSYAAVQLSMSAFAVTMLVHDVGWSLVQAGFLLSCLQIAGVLIRVFAGGIADSRLGGRWTLVILGIATGCTALAASGLQPGSAVWLVFLVMVLFGGLALGWNGVYLAELARSSPPDRIPHMTGASLFFTYGGVLAGPSVFTLLQATLHSYAATYAVTAFPAFFGAALLWFRFQSHGHSNQASGSHTKNKRP